MVTFSRPNFFVSSHDPVHQSISREDSKKLKLAIHGRNQKTIQGHQSPGPSVVGHFNSTVFPAREYCPRILQGKFQEVVLIESAVKASTAPELLGQLNWSIQAVLRQPVWH
ncbi:hypothetical protein O181_019396 [Austropuccinia psidii MF-1]|uniref:Uncharacterized protein n=1 Tax=Austropuccinia psidii MF-1 TaxID=1389203 RepID=A0A9Q3GTU0_9BASI|nr:hypothetical protein [Austropuccinia psidii MF-1]